MKVFVLIVLIFFKGQSWAGWAEETLQQLTLQEKIGQLFVIPALPNFEEACLSQTIATYHIGAILMKQTSSPTQHIALIRALQTHSNLPLLCIGDAEYGLAMRMQNTLSFPKNLALGAIRDEHLLYEFGEMVGKQCKLVGIHLNLAPVVDVNDPSSCPIMKMRSFGDDPNAVSIRAVQVINGMQNAGVLSCAKHFPGHGSAQVDSHEALPTIFSSLSHLERVDLAPFKQVIDRANVAAIMSGHLHVPALDENNPASLSHPIITNLLKKEWGFEGLIITDALNMKALSTNYTTEQIALGAFIAGHDLLLYGAHLPNDVREILEKTIPHAFSAIERGVMDGRISEAELDARVLKVLSVKETLGLHHDHLGKASHEGVMDKLHSREARALQQKLYSEAVLIARNGGGLIPAKSAKYVKLWEEKRPPKRCKSTLVIGINHLNQFPELRKICAKHPRVIIALFLPHYLLRYTPETPTVVGYELCAESERAVWQTITGTK